MNSGIRSRIALASAFCTVALLSVVATIGYLSVVDFTRQSQLDLLNDRLDEVEASIESDGPVRPSASFRVDASVRVIEAGRAIPEVEPGTVRVIRFSDRDDILALVGVVSTQQIDSTLATIRSGLWISILLTGLIVGVITWVVVNQALAPVRRLREQAEAIAADPASELLPVGTADDELSELASTFNAMLAKLRTADDERRRFVSDASHELRSPLMVLTADAEYALRHAGQPAGGDAAELAESVQAQTDRLTTLVDDLLTLAALDEGQVHDQPDRPLSDVLAIADHAGVTMPVLDEREQKVLVPDVTRALANLVANALRYHDDEVELSVNVSSDAVTIIVDDDGPGIPEHEWEHVFKRFYRPDAGRSRSDGGAGLGLAIAKADVDRVGGSLTLAVSPLGGARFALIVPQRLPPV